MVNSNASFAWALKVGATFAIGCVAYLQPFRPMVVVGRSMEPTYSNRSIILTRPATKNLVRDGQVVVIDMPTGPIVKRIAFVSGDEFMQAMIGGHWVDLVYVRPSGKKSLTSTHWRNFAIPKGMVYVMGDNQAVSYDSKQFGCVPVSWIKRILVDQRPYDLFSTNQRPSSAFARRDVQGNGINRRLTRSQRFQKVRESGKI